MPKPTAPAPVAAPAPVLLARGTVYWQDSEGAARVSGPGEVCDLSALPPEEVQALIDRGVVAAVVPEAPIVPEPDGQPQE